MSTLICAVPEETVRRKKFAILLCGTVLYFLTSMAKVLIPGTIFHELQKTGLDAAEIAATGAAFMYAYAGSQLLAGLFSNRYGGVRILLIGGTLFAAGTIGFPLVGRYPLMILCRVLTGLGAGTVFLGVVKLINDLFPAKFGPVLGGIMLCSYMGPTCGTSPMVMLVKSIGWKQAMIAPGAAALTGMLLVVMLMRGTIKPVTRGETIQPLLEMLRNGQMWLLCLSSSVVFGSYYVLSAQIGSKSIADHCGMSMTAASTIIMCMTIVTALNNVGCNLLIKLFGNRRKPAAITILAEAFAGAVIGYFAFTAGKSVVLIAAGFVLIALPAGCFPVFSLIAKELNPPENVGLAVALLNCWCFIFIAAFQNICGRILKYYALPDSEIYPSQAYGSVFLFLAIAAGAGLIGGCFYRETKDLPVGKIHN